MSKQIVDCDKCNGTGYIGSYAHIRGGDCFKCGATGHITRTIKSAKQLEREAAKRAAKDAIREERWAILKAVNAALKEYYKNDPRMRVGIDHPYFTTHCIEQAHKDGICTVKLF